MEPAKLVWFDISSGEGMVETQDGRLLYMHYTCIEGIDKNKYVAPTEADKVRLAALKSGALAQITVYHNLYSERVDTACFGI